MLFQAANFVAVKCPVINSTRKHSYIYQKTGLADCLTTRVTSVFPKKQLSRRNRRVACRQLETGKKASRPLEKNTIQAITEEIFSPPWWGNLNENYARKGESELQIRSREVEITRVRVQHTITRTSKAYFSSGRVRSICRTRYEYGRRGKHTA